jgi:hypothetical protein
LCEGGVVEGGTVSLKLQEEFVGWIGLLWVRLLEGQVLV